MVPLSLGSPRCALVQPHLTLTLGTARTRWTHESMGVNGFQSSCTTASGSVDSSCEDGTRATVYTIIASRTPTTILIDPFTVPPLRIQAGARRESTLLRRVTWSVLALLCSFGLRSVIAIDQLTRLSIRGLCRRATPC